MPRSHSTQRSPFLNRLQVDKVLCGKSGSAHYGSLHLTAHHLIFRYEETDKEEMWVGLELAPTYLGFY